MSTKHLALVLAVLAAPAFCFEGDAEATTATGSLGCSANIPAVCTVNSSSTVPFGAYNPFSSTITQTGTIGITCTTGVASPIVSLDAGAQPVTSGDTTSRQLADATGGSGHVLLYHLFTDNGSGAATTTEWGDGSNNSATVNFGTGTGAAITKTVHGSIAAGQTAATSGTAGGGTNNYTDTVTITVTY